MHNFNVWITLLTNGYVKQLVANLIQDGFGITPLNSDKPWSNSDGNDGFSCVLAIIISSQKISDLLLIYDNIYANLKKLGAGYHSFIIVDGFGKSTWCSGNIAESDKFKIKPTLNKKLDVN